VLFQPEVQQLGRIELGRDVCNPHGMPGLRLSSTGHQVRLFLFDLFTDRAMAHAFLFREGFMDTADFSWGHLVSPLWQRR
jgi:hypothetical protein